jgi:hypothetical protein
MKLVEGYVVAAADVGSTFLDAAKLRGRRFGGREEVEAERFADELRARAVFTFADLLELSGHRGRERDGERGCGTHLKGVSNRILKQPGMERVLPGVTQ